MGEQPEGTEAFGTDRGGDEPRLDAPPEERREPLVDKGSASGLPGAGGTRTTDFRPGRAEASPLDEGGEAADEAGQWSAVGGEGLTDEGDRYRARAHARAHSRARERGPRQAGGQPG